MIYKITSNFEDNLDNLFSTLSKDYYILYYNNFLYVSDIKVNNNSKENLKKKLKPNKNFYIIEITEKNLIYECNYVVNWCKKEFINYDLLKYEKEQQEKLKNIMIIIDEVEKKLL